MKIFLSFWFMSNLFWALETWVKRDVSRETHKGELDLTNVPEYNLEKSTFWELQHSFDIIYSLTYFILIKTIFTYLLIGRCLKMYRRNWRKLLQLQCKGHKLIEFFFLLFSSETTELSMCGIPVMKELVQST